MKTDDNSRREFIKKTSVAGAGLMFFASADLFAKEQEMDNNILSRGYAT